MRKIVTSCLLLSCMAWSSTLSEIRSKGVIKIGVGKDYPPFSQISHGKFTGFEADFGRALAKDIFDGKKGTVKFVGVDTAERLPFLQEDKVDATIFMITVTNSRKKIVDFSTPYFTVDTSVLTMKKDNIKSVTNLRDRGVIVEKGSTTLEDLKKGGFKTLECSNQKECFGMLKEGKGGGWASDNTLLLMYPLIDTDVELGVKQYGRSGFISVAVKKGNKELLKYIDQQIVKLSKDGFFKKAFEEQLNPFYKGTADKKYFLLDDLYKMLNRM